MALINFQQIDTDGTFNVACSARSAGLTTAADQATAGGSAGSTPTTVDPDNNGTNLACYAYQCGKPGASATWDAGTWVVRINFSTGDAGTTLEEVHVCDWLSGTGYTDVDTDTSATALAQATNGGAVTVNVTQSGAHTPQSAADSQPYIVLVFSNTDPHGATSVDITPSLVIDSPIDDGAAAGGGYTGALSMMGVG